MRRWVMDLAESVAPTARGGGTDVQDTFRVDLTEASRDGLLLQNLVIHGRISENGRRYSDQAMADIAERADGIRAFADHPSSSSEVRPVANLVGRVRQPRVVGDRIRAHLQVVDAPPWNSLLPALVEEDDMGVGFSIRARGSVRRAEDGLNEVTEVRRLDAVELVSEPATTQGLTESVGPDAGAAVGVAERRIFGGDGPAPRQPRHSPTAEDVTKAADNLFV